MQSSGGTLTPETRGEQAGAPRRVGPAAGVIACSQLGRLTGRRHLISLDMGGTTAKAAIIEDGQPVRTSEYEVGAGINLSSKLVKGGGHPIKLPFIDVSEIGAGGGSIVAIDRARRRSRVGPRSAGADPGPVCYGLGGDEPDAHRRDCSCSATSTPGSSAAARSRSIRCARARRLDRVVATPLGRSRGGGGLRHPHARRARR